jgi:hypothetical protein
MGIETVADTGRIFELRTYTASPGKLSALEDRFKHHTIGLFENHGMDVIAFFRPLDTQDKLVYLLAFPSEDALQTSWESLLNDPEWREAKAASEVDGPLAAKIESIRLSPTDYSRLS